MWSGAITENFDSEAEEELLEEEEGGDVEGLPTPNDKPLGNIGEGGDGANGAAAPLLGANLLHSSIYKHQLPQKKWLLVKYQQKSLPHGASDNETSHRAEA